MLNTALARLVSYPVQALGKKPTLYRFLEMVPGIAVWTTLGTAIILSFVRPLWVIMFIIAFDLYWLVRVVYLTLYLVISYRRFARDATIDWQAELERIPNSRRLHHLIFLPTYKEELPVLLSTFEALKSARYPKDRLIVVLAGEERDREGFEANTHAIRERYGNVFAELLVTLHPAHLPGELAGKGSNLHWAGKRAKEYIDERKIPYEDVIVSSFDADTAVHPQYFAHLAYRYLTHARPLRSSFQPVPLYNNNIWDSPALMRVVANSTTFWLMTEQVRPERLFTFSSHSMSFKALVDVGFWQKDIVTEDSRIFLQCFLRYDGDYTVTPLSIPVSMDTVLARSVWRSLANQYKQQRRWAWGIEHFPYMMWHFAAKRHIPWQKKLHYLWVLAEGMYSWATAPVLIFILGWLPLAVARFTAPDLHATVLAQNAPFLLELLMRVAMVGLLVIAIISTTLLPPRPPAKRRVLRLSMVLQWVLFPVTMIVFGSIPAIDAQTRLMLGRYLGFHVTEKARR